MIALFEIFVGEPVIVILRNSIELLFSQSSNCLHFSLFKFALPVAQFVLDSFIFLHFAILGFILFLQLMQVKLRVVLTKLSHLLFFLFSFLLLLSTKLQGLLLVDLQFFILEFIGRKFVVWDGDEMEFVFLGFFFN